METNFSRFILPICVGFFLLFIFSSSCSRSDENTALVDYKMQDVFVFDPSDGHYRLIDTKSNDSKEELSIILKQNNIFLDSIIRSELSHCENFIYLLDGKTGVAVKVFAGDEGGFVVEPLTRNDSLFVDPGADSLAVADTSLTPPVITSPVGTLYNGNAHSVFAPYFMRGFNCSLFASAPMALHAVKTRFFDCEPVVGTRIGAVATMYVPVAASNVHGTIEYNCSDSNQPYCMYSGSPHTAP